jgi:hypothetical protein
MPVKIRQAGNQFSFIYPASSWKTIILKNKSEEVFEADTENFYIAVNIEQ